MITPAASEEDEAACSEIVAAKDAHVVAAARASGAEYLLSLDRKHLANPQVRQAAHPLLVLTPGEFIDAVLRPFEPGDAAEV